MFIRWCTKYIFACTNWLWYLCISTKGYEVLKWERQTYGLKLDKSLYGLRKIGEIGTICYVVTNVILDLPNQMYILLFLQDIKIAI